MGFGRLQAVRATKVSSVEARGPDRTARKASRRPGGQAREQSRHALKHILAHVWETLGAAPGARSMASGSPQVVQATQESSAKTQGPCRTVRKAYRRAGRQAREPSRHALKHILAHVWATLVMALGARPVTFGRPKVVPATQESSVEAQGPGRTARNTSRRPGHQAPEASRHALKHSLANFWATLGVAPEARPVAFGRPKVVQAFE